MSNFLRKCADTLSAIANLWGKDLNGLRMKLVDKTVVALKFVVFSPWYLLTSFIEVVCGVADLEVLYTKEEPLQRRQ